MVVQIPTLNFSSNNVDRFILSYIIIINIVKVRKVLTTSLSFENLLKFFKETKTVTKKLR